MSDRETIDVVLLRQRQQAARFLFEADQGSLNRGLLLWSGPGGLPEAGLWECTPGSWRLRLHEDQFCHFTRGKALYSRDNGEQTRIDAHTLVHFPAGWSGLVLVDKPLLREKL